MFMELLWCCDHVIQIHYNRTKCFFSKNPAHSPTVKIKCHNELSNYPMIWKRNKSKIVMNILMERTFLPLCWFMFSWWEFSITSGTKSLVSYRFLSTLWELCIKVESRCCDNAVWNLVRCLWNFIVLVMCERTLVAVVELWNCCREDSSSYLDIIIFRNSIARIFAVGTTVGSLLFVFF